MSEDLKEDRLLQLYQESYFQELGRKDSTVSRLQAVSSLVLVEIGFLGFVIAQIQPHDLAELTIFAVSFWLMCGSIIVAVYFLGDGFLRQKYELFPYLDDTEEYRITLSETYAPFDDGQSLARKYFAEYQIKYLSECASQIGRTNTKRHRLAHLSLIWVFAFTLPAMVSIGVLFVEDRLGDQPNPTCICQTYCAPETQMNEDETNEPPSEPPPPPPPPPKRLERGEKPIDGSRPSPDSDGN